MVFKYSLMHRTRENKLLMDYDGQLEIESPSECPISRTQISTQFEGNSCLSGDCEYEKTALNEPHSVQFFSRTQFKFKLSADCEYETFPQRQI